MKTLALAVAMTAALAAGQQASAQNVGIGLRAGTYGLGGDLAASLGPRVVVRAGIGFMPTEPTVRLDEIDVTVDPPSRFYTGGIDLYLNSAFRIGAGMLLKPDDAELAAVFTQDQEIGGRTFTPQEIGTLVGLIDSQDQAPYVLIGFGKHTAQGMGLFIDLGVAFLGEPDFQLNSVGGTISNQPQTRTELDRQEVEFEDDAGPYLRFWPILNLGFRIGLG